MNSSWTISPGLAARMVHRSINAVMSATRRRAAVSLAVDAVSLRALLSQLQLGATLVERVRLFYENAGPPARDRQVRLGSLQLGPVNVRARRR